MEHAYWQDIGVSSFVAAEGGHDEDDYRGTGESAPGSRSYSARCDVHTKQGVPIQVDVVLFVNTASQFMSEEESTAFRRLLTGFMHSQVHTCAMLGNDAAIRTTE